MLSNLNVNAPRQVQEGKVDLAGLGDIMGALHRRSGLRSPSCRGLYPPQRHFGLARASLQGRINPNFVGLTQTLESLVHPASRCVTRTEKVGGGWAGYFDILRPNTQ